MNFEFQSMGVPCYLELKYRHETVPLPMEDLTNHKFFFLHYTIYKLVISFCKQQNPGRWGGVKLFGLWRNGKIGALTFWKTQDLSKPVMGLLDLLPSV
jgi:hypothetical protein